jgi:hypothetical protein
VRRSSVGGSSAMWRAPAIASSRTCRGRESPGGRCGAAARSARELWILGDLDAGMGCGHQASAPPVYRVERAAPYLRGHEAEARCQLGAVRVRRPPGRLGEHGRARDLSEVARPLEQLTRLIAPHQLCASSRLGVCAE